ncbi:EAL domain-containing protein [Paenalcaligenes niemegkensis]|uniref:EAL domain-containing response regulator n=1 Tax=Paenalcaligenes niemegkensis TaxID=2895469 RepID=UPI001EE79BA4|nr:EAL domain-containing protein [Paenalcaligenes niemegkensis]MCQ9617599.1 EAL domain-containing protein [Paenalcaligenes niemegkensis]
MEYAKQLVVVFDHAARCQAMVDELSAIGVTATIVANGTAGFKSMLENANASAEVLLLHCDHQHFALVIANLRSVVSYSGIVAIGAFEDPAQRIELLLAGADACLPEHVAGSELMALQHALQRRAEKFILNLDKPPAAKGTEGQAAHAAEHFPRWSMRDKGWTLVSPEGVGIQLTYGERFLVELLSSSPEGRVSRQQLMMSKVDTPQNSRAVDSLISRLRRKAKDAGVELPIKSVHGWGYSFAGQIAGSAADALGPAVQAERTPHESPETSTGLLADIRQAYNHKLSGHPVALTLMFQGKTSVKTGAQEGVEAQLYWRLENNDTVRLGTAVYERLDLTIVSWLYECAFQVLCDELQSWANDYKLHMPVTLSVPLPVLMRLHEPWMQKLQSQRLNDGSVAFAITEYNVDVKNEATQQMLSALAALGIPVWLDNYVGSAENLLYLEQWRIYGVRVLFNGERSESQAMQDTSLLMMTCKLCANLGLKTEVTGISSASDKNAVIHVGADYLHGDFISLPLSRDGILLALASGL